MTDLFLDHVLIAVNDIDEAGRTFSEYLGFTVTPQGSHPDRGTCNRLIVFESEYLELIAVQESDLASRHRPDLISFLAQREGLYMFALGTRGIDRTIESLRLRGVGVHDATVGSRLADSDKGGYSWRSAAVDPRVVPGSATFLIQHDQTIAERYQEPANPTQHPNGALRVAQVTLAVADARAAAARWRQLFKVPAGPESTARHVLGDVRRAAVRLGNCDIEFVSPQGPGPIHDILSSFGEYPVMISIVVSDLRRTLRELKSTREGDLKIIDESNSGSCLLGPASTHGLFLLLVDAAAF